jgi:hypothetical protein
MLEWYHGAVPLTDLSFIVQFFPASYTSIASPRPSGECSVRFKSPSQLPQNFGLFAMRASTLCHRKRRIMASELS